MGEEVGSRPDFVGSHNEWDGVAPDHMDSIVEGLSSRLMRTGPPCILWRITPPAPAVRYAVVMLLGMARFMDAFEELSGSRDAPTSAMQEKNT